jgi:hypothetical protein
MQSRFLSPLAISTGSALVVSTLLLSAGTAGAGRLQAHHHHDHDDDIEVHFTAVNPTVTPFTFIESGGGGTLVCNENVTPYDTVTCIDPQYSNNQIYINTTNLSANIVGHLELVGPSVDSNTPNLTYGFHSYAATANFAPGNYCVKFWKSNGGGSYSLLNTQCGTNY